jgi:hypothetical protein
LSALYLGRKYRLSAEEGRDEEVWIRKRLTNPTKAADQDKCLIKGRPQFTRDVQNAGKRVWNKRHLPRISWNERADWTVFKTNCHVT